MLHDTRASTVHITSIPPRNRFEAAEDALKLINHEMCMQLLAASEINARHAGILREVAPDLHDELLKEVRQLNELALGQETTPTIGARS